MPEKETITNPSNHLRRHAEEKAAKMAETLEALSLEETRRILHELRVHQIELEMQNEELRSAQAELNVANARYLDLYDLAPVGYCIISEEGLILEANLTASSLLGMVRKVLVKQPITRFILKGDQDIYYLFRKHFIKAYSAGSGQAGAPRACELRMVKKDGAQFWARLEATAAKDACGAPVCRVMISDITDHKRTEDELRESEERFRKLFKCHAAVKLIIDPETGTIIDANEAAAQFYGWPIEKLKQMRIQQINLLSSEAVKAEMEKAAFLASTKFEFRHQKADGSVRDVEVFSNLIDIAGKGLLYSIIHDITERKKAEESLRESEKALRVLLSEKEILLKEVHHRVKNNLQVISSLISLQADSQVEERLQEVLRHVQYRVQTMTLVHEMLHRTDDLERLDVAEYAASLLQYLWRAHGAEAGMVRLDLSFAPLMLPVEAAVHCGLILNELISNVFKHAFPGGGGGEVSVTLKHDPATGVACLRVRDNGVGLPAGLDWRQSKSLGLRLVQMLAGQLHGTVQSGPGPDLGPGTGFQVNFKV